MYQPDNVLRIEKYPGVKETHFDVDLDPVNNLKRNDIFWRSWGAMVIAITIMIQNLWLKWFSGWVSLDK